MNSTPGPSPVTLNPAFATSQDPIKIKETQMAGNKYEGKVNIALGMTKQKLGELTGNRKLKNEGQMQKLKGVTQDAAVTAKKAATDVGKTALKQSKMASNRLVDEINKTFDLANTKAQASIQKAGAKLSESLNKLQDKLK